MQAAGVMQQKYSLPPLFHTFAHQPPLPSPTSPSRVWDGSMLRCHDPHVGLVLDR